MWRRAEDAAELFSPGPFDVQVNKSTLTQFYSLFTSSPSSTSTHWVKGAGKVDQRHSGQVSGSWPPAVFSRPRPTRSL